MSGVTIDAEAVRMTEEDEVWHYVKSMNHAWTQQRGAGLQQFFHPRMVAITATDRRRLEGRDACLASWTGFAANAEIREWQEHDAHVELFGDTAVVSYFYKLDFSIGGQNYIAQGRDMMTLVRDAERWWIVADHFSALPPG